METMTHSPTAPSGSAAEVKTYRRIVQLAGDALKRHDFGGIDTVRQLWDTVEWQEVPRQYGDRDAELTQSETPVVRLYPLLFRIRQPEAAVLREFGEIIIAKGGQRARYLWSHKLDLPTREQIASVHAKLSDPNLRRTCKSYEQVMRSYPETGSAVDRLVFIHIANALLANNIPYADSVGVDIRNPGPCAEYAAQKRYHSLIPLVSYYCPKDVYEKFGVAFAETVLHDLGCCLETSTAEGLRRIVQNVVRRLDPFPSID